MNDLTADMADSLTPSQVASAPEPRPVGLCDACRMGEHRKCVGTGCYRCPRELHYRYGVSMRADSPAAPGAHKTKRGKR
jgi:hypothetical protein